jgi:Chlamydia polymorphic membrane protein (Chlamydia_PMP) repeat
MADVSHPTTVVGSGTAASCTEQALDAAVAKGGVITFSCGTAPATITVTKELSVTKDTTLDGNNLVALSGGNSTRIMHIVSAWNVTTPLLTVQNLTFTDGYTTAVMNTAATDEGGAAIYEDGGSLVVVHCTFTHNNAAQSGEDVAGGAIVGLGSSTLVVEDSVFSDNSASNGGAIGTQDESVTIVNSTFSNNKANGTGGNPGNGGDGGAMSYDGAHIPWTMCGDTFTNNTAYQQGGAIFRVGYNDEPVNIDRCTFDGNSVNMTNGIAGGIYLEDVTITMSATTISHNSANYGAGFWAGETSIANLTNVTIADNTANMGGGVWFANPMSGTFLNVTIADNVCTGLFSGASVTLQNCLVAGNTVGSMCGEGESQCDTMHPGVGANMQTTGTPNCTSSVIVSDPKLGALQNNGGPTTTMAPAAGSPAIGKGTSCPAEDQRGQPRKTPCTLGAYEVE